MHWPHGKILMNSTIISYICSLCSFEGKENIKFRKDIYNIHNWVKSTDVSTRYLRIPGHLIFLKKGQNTKCKTVQ